MHIDIFTFTHSIALIEEVTLLVAIILKTGKKTKEEEQQKWYSNKTNNNEITNGPNEETETKIDEMKDESKENSIKDDNKQESKETETETKNGEFDNIIDIIDCHGYSGKLSGNELHIYHSEAYGFEEALNDPQYASVHGIHYCGYFRTKYHYLEHYDSVNKSKASKKRGGKKKKKKKGNQRQEQETAPMPAPIPPIARFIAPWPGTPLNNIIPNRNIPMPPAAPPPIPNLNQNEPVRQQLQQQLLPVPPPLPPVPNNVANGRGGVAPMAPARVLEAPPLFSNAPVPVAPPIAPPIVANNINEKKKRWIGRKKGTSRIEEEQDKRDELLAMNDSYRPQNSRGELYSKPKNSGVRLVTVQSNNEFGIFESSINSYEYIIILRKEDWRMCLFLSNRSRWNAQWVNKHNIWFIFEMLIKEYKQIYWYSSVPSILNAYGGGEELRSMFNKIVVRQQRMLTWGHGSMSEALLVPTEVIFGDQGNSSKNDENDSSFDQLLGISASSSHTLFRTSFGTIYAFGSNNWGQLGVRDRKSRSKTTAIKDLQKKAITQLACGSNFSMAADGL